MDKIIAKGLIFEACHGVLPEEQVTPQKFVIDLELHIELQEAGLSDDLTTTINYDAVYQLVKKVVTSKSYALIEALAENIALQVLEIFMVKEVKVTVYKPQAPVRGDFGYFAVEINRTKSN